MYVGSQHGMGSAHQGGAVVRGYAGPQIQRLLGRGAGPEPGAAAGSSPALGAQVRPSLLSGVASGSGTGAAALRAGALAAASSRPGGAGPGVSAGHASGGSVANAARAAAVAAAAALRSSSPASGRGPFSSISPAAGPATPSVVAFTARPGGGNGVQAASLAATAATAARLAAAREQEASDRWAPARGLQTACAAFRETAGLDLGLLLDDLFQKGGVFGSPGSRSGASWAGSRSQSGALAVAGPGGCSTSRRRTVN